MPGPCVRLFGETRANFAMRPEYSAFSAEAICANFADSPDPFEQDFLTWGSYATIQIEIH
jgi:hypothetical protein